MGYHVNPIWTASPDVFISTFINLALICSSILKVQPLSLKPFNYRVVKQHPQCILNRMQQHWKITKVKSTNFLLMFISIIGIYIYIVLFGYGHLFWWWNFSTKMPHPSYLHQVWPPRKCHLHLHRVHGGYDHYLSTSGIVRETSVGNENTRVFLHVLTNPYLNAIGKKMLFSKVRDVRYNGIQWLYKHISTCSVPSRTWDPKLQETLDFFPKHADMLISLHSHGIRSNKS